MKRREESVLHVHRLRDKRGVLAESIHGLFAPVRGFMRRYAPTAMKRISWNSEFKRGKHVHHLEPGYRSRICDVIERYCNAGDVLELGWADGHVGLGLNLAAYSSYTGVDISEVAIREAFVKLEAARGERRLKNQFEAADIARFIPTMKMDVILFKDSLYYFHKAKMLGVLCHLRHFLRPGGVFIVQMDNIGRHGWIRDLIRENCFVVEDREFRAKDFMRLVFR